ncbi:MAG: IclR family transcriptional regulator C-terminal domain-containing protein [Pseudomonadota bacterium]|uniref:IclR family transcriptional regulator n=1 Tax=Variovorax paradoxus TaxID=34073 RepID=A0A2W5SFH4_VARPD|nr:IclR family transcriptional regulator C-terminal domain-containing protein [Pseudomonadota bacterium]MDQ8000350.1 IclR family transcriptional regulator C-terminal domain-containing protein [Pseudomonadota bacterium]MDQ8017774.1 IclR family transcriptional regulator C-terminal domain-containing protein [Pseudomonadota bacterium]PZQ73620.1 MAG: IclR family transcriptional regulator [Variovorax paradoxus]
MRALLQTARASDAARGARSGQVQAVGRAIAILSAFDGREVFLPLAELARRTGMHKPTVLRLARTLAVSRFLVPREDGAWRLGPAAGWLGSRYQAQFDVDSAIEPILKQLCAETGESAAFYVHEGNLRSCLMRCDGPAALPDHVRSGEVLPLDRGAPGRVILAALGEPGDLYERIRRQGFHYARRERDSEAAAVAAAVRGAQGMVLGAISTAGPAARLTVARLRRLAPPTVAAARQLGIALGGMPATALRATWHP